MESRKKKKIAIIGASYLQNPLILCAKSMGIETHVFAWAANDVGERSADHFYPISITEKDKILEVCEKIGVDGVCSIASDLAVITVNYISNRMGLIGNSLENSRLATNKAAMREIFALKGDPSPKNILVQAGEELVETGLKYPLIVKPIDRSGSRGVTEIKDPSSLQKAVNRAIKSGFKKDIIIEEYIEGKEYSVECISFKGTHKLLSVTEKYTTGFPHFIETGHMEPADLDEELRNRVEETVFHALDSLEVKFGASHSEIKINQNETKIIEIGSRMGGDLIGSTLVPITTGIDYVKAVVDIAMGNEPDLSQGEKVGACGIRFVLSNDDIEVYKRLEKEHPEYIIEKNVPETVAGTVSDSSARFGYFVFNAASREQIITYMPAESGM